MQPVGISVEIQARLDEFDRKMAEAGRLTRTVTAQMDKATKRAAQGFTQLEGRLDPVSRAMRRYETDVAKVRLAVEKGAASDARAGIVLDQLAAQYDRAVARVNGLATAQGRGIAMSGGLGRAVQQAGFQVGDFATQVASGSNWVVALTQQGTQLVSMFGGPWGAAVGAAGAIIGALYLGLRDTNDETARGADRLEEYKTKMKAAADATAELQEKIRLATTGARSPVELSLVDAATEAAQKVADARAKMRELQADPRTRGGVLDSQRQAIGTAEEELRVAREKLAVYQRLFDREAEISDAQSRHKKTLDDLVRSQEKAAQTVADLAREADAATRMYEAMRQGEDAVRALNTQLAIENSILAAGPELTHSQADAIARYREAIDSAEASMKRWTEAQEQQKRVAESLLDFNRQTEEAMRRVQAVRQGDKATEMLERELEVENRLAELRKQGATDEDLQRAEKTIRQRQEAMMATDSYIRAQRDLERVQKGVEDASTQAFRSIVMGAESASDAVRNLALALADMALQELALAPIRSASRGVFNSLFSGLFSGGALSIGQRNLALNPVPGMTPRATGGDVMAGSLNLVGDSGRELFVPDTHGTIIPNSQTERMLNGSGGGQSGGMFSGAVFNVDNRGADQAAVIRLEAGLRSLGANVQRMAVSGVRDARRRGQTV